ncbi:hypothetical protein CFC21_004610 [Triticum aestivum]|uniref:Uncharacterized protein n=3 Tax=Triticum TaxID=4564 RepID=A0A9R0QLR9_TRITD|nr:uncharacterized protein LOC123102364 [Triticum aestivum]KAF6986915.1 hypothetical protein CFC21_004610 [Triticum aestivum]VAH11990.1 unnamed protein product [Triticum turgidum subsp. durum]
MLMDDAPPPAAQTLALAVEDKGAKRARKRSRYLDDYETPTILSALHGGDTPPPRKGAASEGPALLLRLQQADVAAPDLLAALRRCAASPYDYEPLVGNVDAGALLAFFALHREASASVSVPATGRAGKDDAALVSSTGQHRSNEAPATAAARPNPCQAMAVAVPHGSAGKEQAGGIAIGHAQAHHHVGVGPTNAAAAAPGGAGPSKRRRKKKVTFALGAPTSAADAGCSAQLAATHNGGAGSAPKKPAKNKKAVNGQQHFSKPVALILQFAPGTAADQLPSKEQLHSTLRGFGPLIEPSTEITKKQARVVFQSGAAAEAAYSCVHTLGHFAAARLQYLRPPPPPPKIPLTDVRKNLERMIASLTGPSLLGKEDSAWSLAGEMQHLLVKVDRALNAGGAGPSTSVAAHRH